MDRSTAPSRAAKVSLSVAARTARFVRFSKPQDYYGLLAEADWLRVLQASDNGAFRVQRHYDASDAKMPPHGVERVTRAGAFEGQS
jgi:hypothetical protein